MTLIESLLDFSFKTMEVSLYKNWLITKFMKQHLGKLVEKVIFNYFFYISTKTYNNDVIKISLVDEKLCRVGSNVLVREVFSFYESRRPILSDFWALFGAKLCYELPFFIINRHFY